MVARFGTRRLCCFDASPAAGQTITQIKFIKKQLLVKKQLLESFGHIILVAIATQRLLLS
jgi:hypothetical protein